MNLTCLLTGLLTNRRLNYLNLYIVLTSQFLESTARFYTPHARGTQL